MIDPICIELGRVPRDVGLYESFYFRGNQEKSQRSFWLKHNLVRFVHESRVRIDNTLVLFDEETKKSSVFYQSRWVDWAWFDSEILKKGTNWHQMRVEFDGGGFFELELNSKLPVLRGMIRDRNQEVSWDFRVKLSGKSYYHFDREWFYRGFFPKKKILTVDCFVEFDGMIAGVPGRFNGMNGHNWGREHAVRYAYANCNSLGDRTFFDGFSAQIKIAGMRTPFLSSGSLIHNDKAYHFNHVLRSWKHLVRAFDIKHYNVTFVGPEYLLEVAIDGERSAWVSLQYDHPNRRKSWVHNTKRARGQVVLKRRENQEVIIELSSDEFELETLTGEP